MSIDGRKKQEDENLGSFYMGRMRPTQPQQQRVLPRGLLTIVTVLAFAGILWYAYPQGQEKYTDMDIPTVAAGKDIYKFKPDDPGGMKIPHQDSTIFDPLEKRAATVEKLLPPVEQPVDKDEALQAGVALESAVPKLNLDLQMKEVATGTEKIVSTKEPVKTVPVPSAKPVSKPVVQQAPAVKPVAAKGNLYIQLGSYRSVTDAKGDWAMLQKKYAGFLSGLSMRTQRVDLGAKGVWYRLQAGTVSEARAAEICADLKKSNPGGCFIAK